MTLGRVAAVFPPKNFWATVKRTFHTSGAVMTAAPPVLIGVQLLLGTLNYGRQNVPRECLQSDDRLPGGAAHVADR